MMRRTDSEHLEERCSLRKEMNVINAIYRINQIQATFTQAKPALMLEIVEEVISKVLLVEHPKKLWPLFGNGVAQPLHLAYLAAVLEKNGIEVDILDCTVLGYGWDQYKRVLEKTSPDIVGVSGITPFLSSAIKTVQITKEVDPHVATVVGGTHFTLTARQSLMDYPEIDYVVCGEGEITLLELVQALNNGHDPSKVRGIAFRDGKHIEITPERPLIEDLDTLPMPAYHKLPMDKYRFVVWGHEMCIMLSSRGCPFACRFCTEQRIWRNRWRGRSASKVVDEMELLKTKYGINVIWFGDDCFNLDRKRNEQFLEELEQRKLDIKWFMEARVDTVQRDADLVQRMSKLGLFYVLLGAESSSENDLRYLHKNINLSQTKKAVALLKKNGVIAQTNFIVGLPNDTKESIKRTLAFAESLNPDIAIFTPITPFPGTDLYDELGSLGLIKETEFEKFDYLTPVAGTYKLSRRQLRREIIKAYVQFYARPLKIVETLCNRKPFARKTMIHVLRVMTIHQFKQTLYDDLSDMRSRQKLT